MDLFGLLQVVSGVAVVAVSVAVAFAVGRLQPNLAADLGVLRK